jgi:hypothetical protein
MGFGLGWALGVIGLMMMGGWWGKGKRGDERLGFQGVGAGNGNGSYRD